MQYLRGCARSVHACPCIFTLQAIPANSIAYIPWQAASAPKIFADGAPAIFRNSNPYTTSPGNALYSVPVSQGQVTQIAVR